MSVLFSQVFEAEKNEIFMRKQNLTPDLCHILHMTLCRVMSDDF